MRNGAPPDELIVIISVLVPLITLLVALAVTYVIGSGWSHVAKHHPLHREPHGETITGVSARIHGLMYKRCLTLHITNEGFAVSSFFPFSLFQKPFFIRWSQVEALQHVRITGFRRLELRIRNETFSLFFHGNTETAIVAVAHQRQLTVKD